ncbi:hypothetical protein KABACHOK_03330 [Brevundimonas phage vB_BpoS-Kabachok]|uniref:Uncharacterized protein n=1 Tax=Brevundimonas phage vB_BpoS-Kabachok TaxID=2948600 RepID=A0A9E7SK58_9CAUD|nr:hypothetical protein KABACHOK_03330 [Brevundimonas phage vB_BpoS-Kabachok]
MSRPEPEENPFDSIHACIAFSPRDWSENHRMAWIYGIVCGWDAESMKEVAAKHRWGPDEVARLKRLHIRYQAQKKDA